MIDSEVVLSMLSALRVYVGKIEKMRPASIAAWKDDEENYWAVLHLLQLVIQLVIDLSNHILSGDNLAAPEDYKTSLLELGRNKVVPSDFADKISGMAGMRNIIIHRYVGVDPEKVFNAVHNDLDDFRKFADYIYDYLNSKGYLSSKTHDE